MAAEAATCKSGRGRRPSDSPLNSVPSFSRKPPWEVRRSLSEGPDLPGKVGGRGVCLVYVMWVLVLVFVCEGSVRTECLVLLLMFFCVYSNPSFHMHFYQCFFMLTLAAPCRTESKWRFCVDTACFVKKIKTQIVAVKKSFKVRKRNGRREGKSQRGRLPARIAAESPYQNLKKGGRFLFFSIIIESISNSKN